MLFVDIPGKISVCPTVDQTRITFRVRNLTNKVYAALSDPGYQDQVLSRRAAHLRSRGLVQMVTPIRHVEAAPRSYEMAASFKW